MNQHAFRFTLNPLGWAIASALLGYSLPALSEGVTPVAGPAGMPVVADHQGIPAVDIVRPDAQGTSHNRFGDYNVDAQGLVINNALQGGQSHLGPALEANRHFQGQAASAIVFEVTGMSSSRIDGAQEIFGQRADYILANPNGISANGASFINTNRATFLVGIPELEDGRIVRLAAGHDQAVLAVGEGGISNPQGALELITPVIDGRGVLSSRDALDITLGHNTLAYADRALLHTAAATAPPVDAHLLGAMRAGRINIVSTAEGAGVKMPGTHLVGREGVAINARGNVQLGEGVVSAAQGDVHLTTSADMRLTAVKVKGENIDITAGKALRLDTRTREQVSRDHEQHDRKAWFIPTEEYSKRTTTTTREHLATDLQTPGDVRLAAGTSLHVSGATVKAGKTLTLESKGTTTVEALVDSREVFETVRHRKHLWRGDSNTTDTHQTLRPTVLEGGVVNVDSVGDVTIVGSRLHSQGDGTLRTAGSATLDSQALTGTQRKADYRGDLAGGFFFGKTANDNSTQVNQKGSEMQSASNLRVEVVDKAVLTGSRLEAKGSLNVTAPKGIELHPAIETEQHNRQARQQGFAVDAGETKLAGDGKDSSKQYYAEVGYKVENTESDRATRTPLGAEIKGDTVNLKSDGIVKVIAGKVHSETGTHVEAPVQQFLAGQATKHEASTTTVGDGALRVTGGMDRAGSSFDGGYSKTALTRDETSAVGTVMTSNGTQSLKGDTLTHEGTSMASKGKTRLAFQQASHLAVTDKVTTEEHRQTTRGSLGASVEYTDITRPIEKVVKGEDQSRFQNQAVEDNLYAPSLGADLMVSHLQRDSVKVDETAKVAKISGTEVQVEVAERLKDVGTHYQATEGKVLITAGNHDQAAAVTRTSDSLKRLDVDVRTRLDTNTGADLNVKVVGSGGSIDKQAHQQTTVPSLIEGKAGIQVQLGTDGRYEGSRFNSTAGDISLKAGGTVALEQARDQQSIQETTLNGSSWAKVGSGADIGKSGGGSVIGKYTTASTTDSQGHGARINTPGAVSIGAGKQVLMEGTAVGSAEQQVASVDIKAGGRAQVSATTDTHQASGSVYGGGVQLSVAGKAPSGAKGGGVGASLELARTDEQSTTATGSHWQVAGPVQVAAGASDDKAIEIKGLTLDAKRLVLDASKGGLAITAATSEEKRDNRSVGVGLSLNGATATESTKGNSAIHGRVTLGLDKLASTTHANSSLRSESLQLDTRRDALLSGVQVHADTIKGTVAGDLVVETRQDQVNGYKVAVDARLNADQNPQGLLNGASALAGPAAGKIPTNVAKGIQKADPGFAPTLHLDVSKTARDTASAQTVLNGREGIALAVEGNTQLNGALLASARGQVDLGSSAVNTRSLSGSDHVFGIEGKLSIVPEEMTQNLLNAFTGPQDSKDQTSDLGLIRTKGHDREQTLQGGIKHKEG
ncbi:hemagglutinin repeat-containing protein [Pseudomonas eucalypticola]|uniref:Hemagglutinin repeat-containing protein n=1 Tax=Pseudomonas eucalypticola TaxID=2599595 RepID=A0A7D5D5K6_9PSED|nr:hemagglutinin repeat-containing protein [Pseudomonas eucalypticola]QKZ03333.1 hemagglutinin repeat-containing protein [Pseudomonas eucalypticola]